MYSIADHIHNYAVWTAARAVQRGLTTTANIKSAINSTGLRGFSHESDPISKEEFDAFHKKAAKTLIWSLDRNGVSASYGQAAKIIAIYLKTSIVLPTYGASPKSKIIHPPIDYILLSNLHPKVKHLGLKKIKWTKLNEIDYFNLVHELRKIEPDVFWRLEKYWSL